MKEESKSPKPIFWGLSILTVILLILVLGPKWLPNDKGEQSGVEAYREGISTQISTMIENKANEVSSLQHENASYEDNTDWLKESDAVLPDRESIPSKLLESNMMGCSKLNIVGNSATLLCFSTEEGTFHLIVVDITEKNEYLRNLPTLDKLEDGIWDDTKNGAGVVQWTERDKSYSIIRKDSSASEFLDILETEAY